MSLHQKKKKKKGVPTLFEVRVTENGPLGLPLVPCTGNNNISAMLSKEPELGHAVARAVLHAAGVLEGGSAKGVNSAATEPQARSRLYRGGFGRSFCASERGAEGTVASPTAPYAPSSSSGCALAPKAKCRHGGHCASWHQHYELRTV